MTRFKRSVQVVAVISLLAVLQGCDSNCINGSGSVVTQTRNLSGFTEVRFGTEGTIYITQDTFFSFRVEGQQDILSDLVTEVEGSELNIYNDHCIRDHAPLVFYVTLPKVNGLTMSGSGEMVVTNSLNSDYLSLVMSGSGNLTVNDTMHATTFSTLLSGSGEMDLLAAGASFSGVISGSGNIDLAGHSPVQTVTISGSGNYQAYPFITDNTTITISGSGNSELFVNDVLNVTISGSGNVYYKGNASVNTNISGSGSVIHVN